MKEDKITKRIKELQNDRRFMFKLTEDIIALTYRIAIEDYAKSIKDPDKVYHKEEQSPVKTTNKFGSKQKYDDNYIKELKFKVKKTIYRDLLKYIENHSDLMDVYIYVKDKAKTTQDEELLSGEYNKI